MPARLPQSYSSASPGRQAPTPFLPHQPAAPTSAAPTASISAPAAPATTPAAPAASAGAPLPRRIVFLAWRDLDNPAAGGSELLVDRIADGLTARGHDVTLLCGGPAASRNYRVVSAGGAYDHFLRTPRAFAREVGSCDLLVEVCNGMPYMAPLWHDGPTMCLVNHVHTDLWGLRCAGPTAGFGRWLERRALTRAHRGNIVASVSPSTSAALRGLGVPGRDIRIVPNGVEEPGPVLPESPEPLFLAVGRLVEYKRIDMLLRLWDRVRPITGGKLVIVGDGPERRNLEDAAGPGVVFAGRVSEADKHRLLCQAWLLLHPSLLEGWGLVVMEAAVRGTPAVGFDIPGLRDSVQDGVTGMLAQGESSFAAAWCALALSPERRGELGRAARRRAAGFHWERTVDLFTAAATEAYLRGVARQAGTAVHAGKAVRAGSGHPGTARNAPSGQAAAGLRTPEGRNHR